MKRRTFIKDTALLVAAASTGNVLNASVVRQANHPDKTSTVPEAAGEDKLIASAPMLQNYAEDSMGVAFAVSALANAGPE